MISIVPLSVLHLPMLVELEKDCFSLPWTLAMFESELHVPNARYYIALNNEILVGYAGVHVILDEGHITNIAVRKDYRRQGVASMLIDKLMEIANEHDLQLLTLEVRAGNLNAKKLYEKYGFIKEGIRKNYYSDNGEDAEIMTWRRRMCQKF